ncbi:hypothetical protein [Paracoccus beibuensis]|uniref:hypothetical protein n=1 Tax=Paracoccus beibuensis TaxID=547602 RepID=UPI00223F046A|nr:hypothetical protein [Paracoccus beibuensis]
MAISDDPVVCADVEGLICLSDLPDLAEQPLCSVEQPCLSFFPGMGFRPAAWVMQRDQYGDRAVLVVSGDDAYLAKYDGPVDAFAFLPDMPMPFLPELPASGMHLLATPTPGAAQNYGRTSGFPGFFGGSGSGGNDRPDDGKPGPRPDPGPGDDTHTGGGEDPDLPPLAPVPLSGSGLFLVVALAALMLKVGHRRLTCLTA